LLQGACDAFPLFSTTRFGFVVNNDKAYYIDDCADRRDNHFFFS